MKAKVTLSAKIDGIVYESNSDGPIAPELVKFYVENGALESLVKAGAIEASEEELKALKPKPEDKKGK